MALALKVIGIKVLIPRKEIPDILETIYDKPQRPIKLFIKNL